MDKIIRIQRLKSAFSMKGDQLEQQLDMRLEKVKAHIEQDLQRDFTKEEMTLQSTPPPRGIGIVLQDFGTGYFSLDSLRKLKPNKVKVDKIFVQNIDAPDGVDGVIVASTIHLVKSLGMEIVIEGIETNEQLNFVKQKDCDLVQGYLFSKPVQEQTFIEILNVGLLKPKSKAVKKVTVERRGYYRFAFPAPMEGFLRIVEYNGQPVNVGKTPILIENISLGGLKFQSKLKLPVNEEMKFSVAFTILDEIFQTAATLIWCNDEKMAIYSYGIRFMLDTETEKRLSALMNKLSTFNSKIEHISGTPFIYEQPYKYFGRYS